MSKDRVPNDHTGIKENTNDKIETAQVGAVDGSSEMQATPLQEEGTGEGYDGLKEELDKKDAQLAEYLDTLKRVQAEMENFRKRMQKEQEQIIQYAAQTVILELLPVIDNLERALDTARAENESGKLYEGVELIYSQLKRILEKECVEVINPVGEEFDPLKHEAVMQVDGGEHKQNTVVEVMQKGYDLKGRLLRAAMVVVAK